MSLVALLVLTDGLQHPKFLCKAAGFSASDLTCIQTPEA